MQHQRGESVARVDVEEIEFDAQLLGAMPIVNHFIARLKLDDALDTAVPHDDARVLLAPSSVLGVVVRHLTIEHRPLYEIAEWAANYAPELLGLNESELVALKRRPRGANPHATVRRQTGRVCSRPWCSPWCARSRSIVRNSTTTRPQSP
jgi:hypothetical protein